MNTLTIPQIHPDAPSSRRSSTISARWRMLGGDFRPASKSPNPASSPSHFPAAHNATDDDNEPRKARRIFQRVISVMHVVGVIRHDADDRRSSLGLFRRDSASTAMHQITVPVAAAAATAAGGKERADPQRVLCFRIRPEWVLDPAGNRFYYWLTVVSIAILYNTVMIVPRSVFQEFDQGPYTTLFLAADYICDLLYLLDIGARMLGGYLEEGVMVHEPRKLMWHYLHTKGAIVDIVSVAPTDLALPFTGILAPYPFVRINRVLKFYRFEEYFSRLESRTNFPDLWRMVNLMLTFVALIHLNACLYYFISDRYGLNSDGWVYPGEADWRKPADSNQTNADDSLYQKYLWSFYWSLQTITLVAQIKQPEFEGEFLFVTINSLFGVIIYANIVGNVSRIIMNMNRLMDAFRSRMDEIKKYMTLRKIDESLQERVVRYYEYQWTNQHFANETNALACLPDKLEAELALKVHLETLQHVRIFQDVEPGLLADLVLKIKLEIYSPGDFICRKGDIGKEMYIVKRGKLEVVADNGQTVFATLSEGSVFGEISILNIVGIRSGNRRTANVRSVGYSDLFCLSKEALWDALREYPEAKRKMLGTGKKMLVKDGLLDEEVAESAELRQNRFIDKIEKVESDVEDLTVRLARLAAEEKSSMQKMRCRVDRMKEIVRIRKDYLKSQGVVW